MVRRVLVSLCLVALLASAVGYAATTGRMKGTVKDNDGVALPGVTVQIASDNLIGGAQVAITGGDGGFSFAALPVGAYTVEASLVGFKGSIGEVRVNLDATASVAFTLVPEQFGGEIEVTAQVPVVDTAQVNSSQVFDQDFLQNAAIGATGRSYQSVVGQAAGVGGGSNPNVFGGVLSDNNYLIDGVSSTDPLTQTFGTNFNYDAIEEVSIQTGGYEAEFGQATGGIINLVTKSGGNNFSGSVDFRYRNQDFTESGDYFDPDEQSNSFQDYSGTLGGPILRDKLWFFVSAEYVKTERQNVGALFPRVYEGTNYIGKLTWQISDSNRAVIRYSGDPADIPGGNSSQFVEPAASYTQEQGGTIVGFELNSVLSEALLLNFKGGMTRGILDGGPTYGTELMSNHFNEDTTINSNNYFQTFTGNRDRDEIGAHLSWFVDEFAGSHEFKFGAEYTKQSFDDWDWDNGAGSITDFDPAEGFIDLNGDGYVTHNVAVSEVVEGEIPGYNADGTLNQAGQDVYALRLNFKGDITTFFVQDSWRPTANLTIKPGVRLDSVQLDNAAQNQIADMQRWQPRLGVAWDIMGNAKYVARASWGQFMDPTALTISTFASGVDDINHTYTSLEYYCNLLGQGDPSSMFCNRDFLDGVYGESTEWINGEGFTHILYDTVDAAINSGAQTIDQLGYGNLVAPYSEQLILAFEMQVASETSVELTYVNKTGKDLIEDTCPNNTWAWDGSEQPSLDDPSTWTTVAGCVAAPFVISNFVGMERNYEAIIARFETRGDWWHAQLNWTNSESKGNHASDALWSYARELADAFPISLYNTYGYLPDHRDNRVKASGYFLLKSWTFGVDAFWSSPGVLTPYSTCTNYTGATPEALEFYGYGTEMQELCGDGSGGSWNDVYGIFLEPRGSVETKSVSNFDLSITKAFNVGPTDMSVIFTIYNVAGREQDTSFNGTAFRTTTEETGIGSPVFEGSYDEHGDPEYTYYVPIGQPLTYGTPRQYELGFRLTF